MKHITLLSLLFVLAYAAHAQSNNTDCSSPTSQIDLDINNVRARMLGGGSMWWDLANGRYIVPNVAPGEKEVSAIFAGGLWIGGYDAASNLRVAAQTYYHQGGNDFWSGPIDEQSNETDAESCQTWDRHWRINQSEIETHIADFQDNGQIDNPIPNAILTWPGRNNPEFNALSGTDLPDRPLAPFVDVDGNGIYQASAGDYPKIKGDQSIWWLSNDVGNTHGDSGGFPLGIEIATMAYAFYSNQTELNNTTFYEYTITNKSTEHLFDLYVGLFVDIDLGCYKNDYMGCDTLRNLAYGYNAEATDPDCDGVNGYGDEIPLIGIRILDGMNDETGNSQGMTNFMSYSNNMTVPGNPGGAPGQGFYDAMRSLWADGSPVEYGGNGYQQGTYPTNYMYPSNPSDTSSGAWSDCSVSNPPNDRRILMSTGPGNLAPGESELIAYAVIWTPDVPHPCPDITPLQTASDVVENVYKSIITSTEIAESTTRVTLYPNPMTTASTLHIEHDLQVESIQLYSADGRLQRNYEDADNQLTIEREYLSSGIYFYNIKFENGQRKGGKFVIQ